MIFVLSAYTNRQLVFRSEADIGTVYVVRSELRRRSNLFEQVQYVTLLSSGIFAATLGGRPSKP